MLAKNGWPGASLINPVFPKQRGLAAERAAELQPGGIAGVSLEQLRIVVKDERQEEF